MERVKQNTITPTNSGFQMAEVYKQHNSPQPNKKFSFTNPPHTFILKSTMKHVIEEYLLRDIHV